MISEVKDENNRNFILSFFCGDDTIQIYQNADKNSGIWGGKFLERKKHDHPTEQRYIKDSDFQIGGLVKIGVYTFQLLKADDFTIQYMRERPQKFPEVDLQATVNKIRNLSNDCASYEDFLISILKSTFNFYFRCGPRKQTEPRLRLVLQEPKPKDQANSPRSLHHFQGVQGQ